MKKLFIGLQAALPQHRISRLIGRLAALEHPLWLKNGLIRLFMRSYGISLEEAEFGQPDQYRSFNHFFTRALKPGARPMADTRYVAPADGVLSQCGEIDDGQLIQAKGRWYDVRRLLAGGSEEAAAFDNGAFATVYLSPRDYHRVHLPISGTLRATRYVPGELFAVNQRTAEGVNQLFARNERLVCLFDTADGPMALVLVGAIIVAGIETVWGGVEEPQPGIIREHHWDGDDAPTFSAGDEIGRFFLGSTAIVLTSRRDLDWQTQSGAAVRVLGPLAN